MDNLFAILNSYNLIDKIIIVIGVFTSGAGGAAAPPWPAEWYVFRAKVIFLGQEDGHQNS